MEDISRYYIVSHFLIVDVLPLHRDAWDFVWDQRKQQFNDIEHTTQLLKGVFLDDNSSYQDLKENATNYGIPHKICLMYCVTQYYTYSTDTEEEVNFEII